jgi:hypothetical protein
MRRRDRSVFRVRVADRHLVYLQDCYLEDCDQSSVAAPLYVNGQTNYIE